VRRTRAASTTAHHLIEVIAVPADNRPVALDTLTGTRTWQDCEFAFTDSPAEIPEGDWHHARNMLPVVGWRNDSNGESFKVPGRLDGDAATIYVRINDRHFVFGYDIRTPHADCCRRVAQSKAYTEPRKNSPAIVSTWADDRQP
jgi:hypothetical protein